MSVNPELPFYLVVPVSRNDGTIEIDDEAPSLHQTEDEAREEMLRQCNTDDGCDLEAVMFYCAPVARTVRQYAVVTLAPSFLDETG